VQLIDDTRAAWGAASSSNPRRVDPTARKGISWHYDGGNPLGLALLQHTACLRRVKADQAFHQATRGWADIGYNALVCQHGRVIEGRGLDLIGAHSPGVNVEHYGVQFMVGGAEAPTPAAYRRAAQLAADLAAHSGHQLRQWGHKDDPQASTECPGATIEGWVHQGLATTTPQEDDMFSDQDRAQLARIERALTAHDTEEDERYKVDAARYGVYMARFNQLGALLAGIDKADPAAIAEAIPAELASQVADELGKRIQGASS